MVVQAIEIFGNALSCVAGWFVRILVEGQLSGIYLAAFFVFLCGKFLLAPLVGSSASDQVKRKKD